MTARLHGHGEAVAAFAAALAGGALHHAWLLAGPPGIGKALFARLAAARFLAEGAGPAPAGEGLELAPDHPTARLVAAGSHPDLMLLERLPRDKKLAAGPKSEWPGDAELARNISIAQVRSLHRLFDTTPSLSPRRAVIVDSIDDLERPAANALLKNLEEPPPESLFLLVSHAPQRLLPTIRSRCRLLRMKPLAEAEMKAALADALPEADAAEIEALAAAGEGAPGRALAWRGLDIAALDR
ncbi:MAG: DNA polymerase III subunit delta', partial [Sphingomonadaceae bacterium]